MTIQDIHLGDFSAENDSKLSEYFLEETQAYGAAENINDHRYILLGRTGSGKSAILSYLHEKFGNDSRYICTFIRPGKSHLDAIVQTREFDELKQAKGLQNILYKLIWNYVIMVTVLREKYGDKGPLRRGRILSGDRLKAYRFLNKAEQLAVGDKTLFDIVLGLVKEISITLKDVTLKTGSNDETPYKVMRELIKETEEFHDKGFWDVVGGAKLYLLFDDLDIGWNPQDESQQLLLKGLFEIMKSYAYRERVKPLIALRTNILDGLEFNQREKYENNMLPLRWTKPQLEKMLLLRLRNHGNWDNEDDFDKIFEFEDNSNIAVDYMIERTLYRPRDLLAFCKYAISEAARSGADKISIENVKVAEHIYSTNRLQALADEWKYLYPKLDKLITLIIKIAKKEYKLEGLRPKEIAEILEESKERILTEPSGESEYSQLLWVRSYFPQDDPTDLVRILYKLGTVGVHKASSKSPIFVHESLEMPSVDRETLFSFHPVLHQISTTELIFKEENPWKF